MKTRIAIVAACAGTLVLASVNIALATIDPIPGVDIIVKKNPGGTAITVGNCQSGGGKVVKIRGQWSCTGFPKATSGIKSGKKKSGEKEKEGISLNFHKLDAPYQATGGSKATPFKR